MAIACFDIGGTGVKSACIDNDKQVKDYQYISTPENLEDLIHFIDSYVTNRDIEAISLSVPGAINQETGYIEGLSAVPFIHGISWFDILSHHDVPVYLENDANCVGLSELFSDDAVQNFACVVVGTGIGGAVIIDRKLIRGRKYYGGEFGYMMIKDMSSPIQNWSQLASTGSLVRRVVNLEDGAYHDLNGKDIVDLAQQGNQVCLDALDNMIQYLCQGLLNIYYALDPEVIYVGGSISQNTFFMEKVQDKFKVLQQSFPDDLPEIPIVQACTYTKDANLIGAYVNAAQRKE